MCIAGLVLGIVGLLLCWIPFVSQVCALLGIVFGVLGMRNVQLDPAQRTGYGMGVAGLVTGSLGLVGGIIIIIIVYALP
jgi:hypothetical protein